MKKNKQEILQEKIKKAQKLFTKLEVLIKNGKHPSPKNTSLVTLEQSVQDYARGDAPSMYNACIRMYLFFQVSKDHYSDTREKLKILLRHAVAVFKNNISVSPQQLELF